MIGASISPDASGAYLLETKLSQPISLEGNDFLSRIATELPPDRLFPTGMIGGAGMLVPAQYSGGELVSTYQAGQSIDLAAAIDNFGRQMNGETVSEPYVFSPNTRRFLVDANTNSLIGWQTIMLTAPVMGETSPFSIAMQDNGDNPQFSDGTSSMGGWWDTMREAGGTVSNFFTGDYPWWAKVGVGVGVVAAAVGAFFLAKGVLVATGIAGLGKLLAAAGLGLGAAAVGVVTGGISLAAGALTGFATATGLSYVSAQFADGYKSKAAGGGMPAGLIAKTGYGLAAAVDGAAKADKAIKDLMSTVGDIKRNAENQLSQWNDKFNSLVAQYGSWFEKLKPWLIGAILLGGGYAAYNIWGKNR